MASFPVFVDRHYREVLSLVVAVYGPRDAEDIVQDAFARAQAHWPQLAGGDRPGRWVRRVALNLAVSRYRRWRAEARALSRLGAGREVTAVPLSVDTAQVWAEVRRLPARQAQVIALRYIEDLSTPEIAATLGLAEGTVRAVLHQARRRLARRLDDDLDLNPGEEQR